MRTRYTAGVCHYATFCLSCWPALCDVPVALPAFRRAPSKPATCDQHQTSAVRTLRLQPQLAQRKPVREYCYDNPERRVVSPWSMPARLIRRRTAFPPLHSLHAAAAVAAHDLVAGSALPKASRAAAPGQDMASSRRVPRPQRFQTVTFSCCCSASSPTT